MGAKLPRWLAALAAFLYLSCTTSAFQPLPDLRQAFSHGRSLHSPRASQPLAANQLNWTESAVPAVPIKDSPTRRRRQEEAALAEQAARMMERGSTATQVSAYLGVKMVKLKPRQRPVELKVTPSNEFVERDEEGDLKEARYVYVDEYTCIGCTNCASCAPNTFFMEDDHGRARVYRQYGDRKGEIQTAIETCPVDCIHYVEYKELQRLERERENLKINYKARLVGSDALLSGPGADMGMQDISGNRDLRCNNCPTRGCFKCPMFGVGENPEYKKRKATIDAKRSKRQMDKQIRESKKRAEL